MNPCRCPHCGATFQVHIPPDSEFWQRNPIDEEGFVCWVCLDCHRKGLRPIEPADEEAAALFYGGVPGRYQAGD